MDQKDSATAMLAAHGVKDIAPDLADHIVRLIRNRQKILAIKELREAAPHYGLKDAKDVVDSVARDVNEGIMGAVAGNPTVTLSPVVRRFVQGLIALIFCLLAFQLYSLFSSVSVLLRGEPDAYRKDHVASVAGSLAGVFLAGLLLVNSFAQLSKPSLTARLRMAAYVLMACCFVSFCEAGLLLR